MSSRPGGREGWEWNFEDTRVRKIAYSVRGNVSQGLGEGGDAGGDLFFDDEDVLGGDREMSYVLYHRDQNILHKH